MCELWIAKSSALCCLSSCLIFQLNLTFLMFSYLTCTNCFFLVLILNFSPSSVSLPVPLCADIAQSSAQYSFPFTSPHPGWWQIICIASVITDTYFSSLWSVSWTSNPHYHSSSTKTLLFFIILHYLGKSDSLSTLTGIWSLFLP